MSVSASLSMCKEAFSMTGNKSRIPRRCKETMAKVEQKQVVVNEIKEKLEKAASVVMVDARGLTVEQDTALRKQLRDAGVDYKVYKNTMMHFAIQGTEFDLPPVIEFSNAQKRSPWFISRVWLSS